METLVYIVIGIIAIGIFCLYVQIIVASYLKWSDANRRAREILRSVLTVEQYYQLMRKGYVDIPSPRIQERTYRVPQFPGLVGVMEQGRRQASLCLQPLEWVPDADIVVMHKLLIEADEETYLHTANVIAPIYKGNRII